jgi:hypothetical protein
VKSRAKTGEIIFLITLRAPNNTRPKVANLLRLAKQFFFPKPAGIKGALELHANCIIFAEAPAIRCYIRA